jgi:hypothetical protein
MPTPCRGARRRALVVVGGSLLAGAAWGATPKDQVTPLDQRAFFRPELYLSSSHVPLEDVISQLPNRPAWEGFLLARGENPARPKTRVYIDPRSGVGLQPPGVVPDDPG